MTQCCGPSFTNTLMILVELSNYFMQLLNGKVKREKGTEHQRNSELNVSGTTLQGFALLNHYGKIPRVGLDTISAIQLFEIQFEGKHSYLTYIVQFFGRDNQKTGNKFKKGALIESMNL